MVLAFVFGVGGKLQSLLESIILNGGVVGATFLNWGVRAIQLGSTSSPFVL